MTDTQEDKELVEAVENAIRSGFPLVPVEDYDQIDVRRMARAVIPIIRKHYEQQKPLGFKVDFEKRVVEPIRQDERERIAREQATPSAGMIDAADASAKSRRWKTLPYYDSWSVMAARFWRDKYGIDPAKLSEVKP